MKRSPSSICTTSVAALLAVFSVSIGRAVDQTYDATNVANVWDLTTQNWDGSTTLWTNTNSAIFGGTGETVELSGGIVVGDITFNSTGYNITDTNNDGTLTLGGPSTITVTSVSDTATISDGLASGAITKEGSGTLVLSGANTYSGTTTVNAGYLKVGSDTALGDTTGQTFVTSTVVGMTTIFGTVVLADGVTVTGETITIAGSGANFAGALQADSNASATWGGTVNLAGGARLGAQNGGVLTVSGLIQGNSDLAIGREPGSGTPGVVVISGTSNTYTGRTDIVRGILKIGATDALPTGTTLNVDSTSASEDSIFDLNGFDQTVAVLQRGGSGSGGGSFVTNTGASPSTLTVGSGTYDGTIQNGTSTVALTKTTSGTLTLSDVNTYSGATTISAGTLTLSGSLSGTAITVNGAGALSEDTGGVIQGASSISLETGTSTLRGANTYTGTTTVGGGAVLNILSNTALGATSGSTTVLDNSRVVLGDGVTVSGETITLTGSGGNSNGALQTADDATAEWTGNIVLGTGARLGGGVRGTLTVSGVISGSSSVVFGRANDSTTILNAVNTYTGDTQIFANAGSVGTVLRIGVDNAINAASRLSTLGALATVDSTLDLNGHILTLRALDNAVSYASGARLLVANNATGTTSVLTLSDPAANTTTFTGILKNGGGGTGILSLVKSGIGTQILSAANTYTGPTTVNAGTLQIGDGTSGFGGTGSLASTAFNLNGGTFALNNSGVGNNNTDRISNVSTFNFKGGTFLLTGSNQAATNSSETVGSLALLSGLSKITVSYGSTNTATLTASQFSRSVNQGLALVNGVGLGKDSASTASVARIFLTTPPTLIGTTAALATGINSAAKNTQIVPYLLGEATSTTGGVGTATGTANTFLTYNATTGLRPLNLTDEFTLNAYTTGNNTRLTSATSVTSSVAINSLILEGASATINSGQLLTVNSGAILFSSGTNLGILGGGSLTFASGEGIVTINSIGNTDFYPVITDSTVPVGMTYAGASSALLVIRGQSTYTGNTLLQVNTAATANSTGPAGTPTSGAFGRGTLILGGGGLRATGGSPLTVGNTVSFAADTEILAVGNTLTFTGPVTLVGGNRTLTQNSSNATTFTGNIGDGGNALGLTIAGSGSGPVVLSSTSNSTYTGATRVKAGTLVVSGSLSGSSAVTIGDSSSLSTPAVLGGGGTVGNVTVGAAAGNTGARLQPHAGSASTSTGTTLQTGALAFADGSAHLALQLGRTSAFSSGTGSNGAGDVSDHVRTTGAVTLNGADLQLSLLTTTGYTIANNDVFFLIINGGGSPIGGTFGSVNGVATTLSEGSTFNLGPQWYSITYLASFSGNTFTGGNDVALMAVVPEPGVLVTLFGGLGALVGLQRFRRRHSA